MTEKTFVFGKGDLQVVRMTHHVIPYYVNVKAVREKLGMTKEEFAHRFGFEVEDVEKWETGEHMPDPTARMLLTLVDAEPERALQVLHKSPYEAW